MTPPKSKSLGPVAGMSVGVGAEGAVDEWGAGWALFDGAGDFEVDGAGELLGDAGAAGVGELLVFTTSGEFVLLRCRRTKTPPTTSATNTTPITTKDTTDPPWFVRA